MRGAAVTSHERLCRPPDVSLAVGPLTCAPHFSDYSWLSAAGGERVWLVEPRSAESPKAAHHTTNATTSAITMILANLKRVVIDEIVVAVGGDPHDRMTAAEGADIPYGVEASSTPIGMVSTMHRNIASQAPRCNPAKSLLRAIGDQGYALAEKALKVAEEEADRKR